MRNFRAPTGLPGFTLVASGQLVSLLGSEMSQFGLMLWAYEQTGLATSLALLGFFHFLPLIVVSPFAGALVDRSNRKLMMMLSDLGSACATLLVLGLYLGGSLQIWQLYLAAAISGAFHAFQWPAFSAAISTMVPKEHYARANGMMALSESVAGIGAPVLAAVLYGSIGVGGLLAIDLASFLVALGALLAVKVPQPRQSAAGLEGRGSLRQEAIYGFRYIFARPSLLGLQTTFLLLNLFATFGQAVQPAMILSRTANDGTALGIVRAAAGIGGVLGGLLLSTWGGPRRKVHGVLLGMVVASLSGGLLMGLGQGVAVWALASFIALLSIPILNGSNQAIWQAKVPPDVQGRVFAARRMIAWVANPLAMLLAGPVADRLMTPAMMPGGALAGTFGGLVGTGPGAGIALMLVFTGILGALVGLGGYLFPAVRDAETLLPDHDHPPPPEPAPEASSSLETPAASAI
jgi:DHA3 family macrolide efflux protein-like MFS transporter